ncbi:MAG: hypothetical protein ACW97P_11665 [Candidatus Hodarchaeales archaeon]|jgi:hypothetical protein
MFWDSFFSALKVLTYWETHVAILEYLSLFLVPTIVACFIMRKKTDECIKYLKILLSPSLEAIAVGIFVLTLFPIILDLGEDAFWFLPLKLMRLSPGGFLGLLGILMALAIVLSVIPKIARMQSFKTLVLGGTCLVLVQICLSFIYPTIGDIELMYLVPGFWFIVGIIVISGVLSKLSHFMSVSFITELRKKFGLQEEVSELMILPITAIFGFIPVFIYGAWLA